MIHAIQPKFGKSMISHYIVLEFELIAIGMPLCVVQSAFWMMAKLQHWKLPNKQRCGIGSRCWQ